MTITINELTRDDARRKWASSGLTYDAVSDASLKRLRDMIDDHVRSSGLIRRSFRAGRLSINRHGCRANIDCCAFYFKNRQAVTFEHSGFIGFAGWADDTNVKPILAAFCAWVDEMAENS